MSFVLNKLYVYQDIRDGAESIVFYKKYNDDLSYMGQITRSKARDVVKDAFTVLYKQDAPPWVTPDRAVKFDDPLYEKAEADFVGLAILAQNRIDAMLD